MPPSSNLPFSRDTVTTNPIMITLIGALLFLLIAFSGQYYYAEHQAQKEVRAQASQLANSVEILMTPLLLSDDRVSLNYIANQLVQDPSLSGIKLTDAAQLAVAIAGEPSRTMVTRRLEPNGDFIGELTLWVNTVPLMEKLKGQLLISALATLIALFFGALVSTFFAKRSQPADDAEPQEFAKTLQEKLGQPDADLLTTTPDPTELSAPESDEDSAYTEFAPDIDSQPEDQEAPASETATPDANSPVSPDANENSDAPISFADIRSEEEDELVRANLQSWAKFEAPLADPLRTGSEPSDLDTEESETLTVTPSLRQLDTPVPTLKSQVDDSGSDTNVDLIDLLRPTGERDSMPKFKPSPLQPIDEAPIEEPETEEIDIPPVPVKSGPARTRKIPIITEEQLDLYTLEQELDLLLPAQNAGYLLLIDSTSAHSAHLEADEARLIRRTYRTLANSVARIYHGKVEAIGDDIEIRFDEPDEDDAHGINALCAGVLFNILYRSYNQSRIKQMAPVLNLHLALVRGKLDRFSHLLDEARFLTRSTQSNNLISHTALTETPDLKSGLLNGAEIKREDEDKVLILKVEQRHQALLEKQARYLLAKLAERAATQK